MVSIRTQLLSLAAGLALGCAPRTQAYDVKLITQACGGDRSPVEGVSYAQLRVTGDGMEPLTVTGGYGDGSLSLPEVPAGKNRRIEARAYQGDPATGGQMVSLGRSTLFDIPEIIPAGKGQPVSVTVFLRRVNAFSRLSSASNPDTCTGLKTARAGHGATLLPDGRVYVSGGFSVQGSRRSALSSAEIFYPSSGEFSQAEELAFVSPNGVAYPTPRAFHVATLLNSGNGQVLITGGETYTDSGNPAPITFGLLYDPPYNDYGVIRMKVERSRHQAARDETGRVVLVGGVDKSNAPIASMEYYQAGLYETKDVVDATGAALTLKRVGHSMAPVQGGKFLAVAGGSDGATLQDAVRFLAFDGERFGFAESTSPQLRDPRRGGVLAPFRGGEELLLLGGFNAVSESSFTPVVTTELLKTGQAFQVSDGPALPSARGHLCAAPLGDGRVLTVGGYLMDAVTGARSDSSAELVSPKADGTAEAVALPPMNQGRHFATCTLMQDGSVLVLGGVNAVGATQTALDEAWVFTPAPLE
ncbi:MAG: hypothetical protein FJ086_02695 [Deltaproteobacteria bacterium]|nr:hypothetical protein [Deltaproteobacteria bacterium]